MRVGPFGMWEILIILFVVLIIFGPSRLPSLARGIGQSIKEFRSGIKEVQREIEAEASEIGKEAPAGESAKEASVSKAGEAG